jgi:hypothetical protein
MSCEINRSRHERMCVAATPERKSARIDVAMTGGALLRHTQASVLLWPEAQMTWRGAQLLQQGCACSLH